MAGAEHRHQLAAGAVRAIAEAAGKSVQLTDRPLQVLLTDLVVGSGHPPRIGRRAFLSLRLHQDLRPVARRTRRWRDARRAGAGSALVWGNFRAWASAR